MPEPTQQSAEEVRKRILANMDNINQLMVILRDLKTQEHIPMEERVQLMLLVFTTESKTPKHNLLGFLWNFLKILYNDMDKLVLKLVPAITFRYPTCDEKHIILYKSLTSRMHYVMLYFKDTSEENIGTICKNVLVLGKFYLHEKNYEEFMALCKDTFFNPKFSISFHIKLFANQISSPAHDLFLEHFLTRISKFGEASEEDLQAKKLKVEDVAEYIFQIYMFYVNHEGRVENSKFRISEKLFSVLVNFKLSKEIKSFSNALKCLYCLVQFMKEDERQEAHAQLLYQYMSRICDKAQLNSCPYTAHILATIALVLEKNSYFQEEKRKLPEMSLKTVEYLLATVKLTVSFNVEPTLTVCEHKDCLQGAKKHTITNFTRFAFKIFTTYVKQLEDTATINDGALNTVTQLAIFHFHLLQRLDCPSRIANEHNDIRRLYSTFSHRSRANPPASLIKIFEVILKYVLQRNLTKLVTPISTILTKYYVEIEDHANGDRVEWFHLLCKLDDPDEFDLACYNWVVKKQKLPKEKLLPMLITLRDTKWEYNTELIPKDVNAHEVFHRVLENIAMMNEKAFRVFQECLVELVLDKEWQDKCSEEVASLLFHATENQVVGYKETIRRNKEFFENQPERNVVQLAILESLEYQLYNAELRLELKSVDLHKMQQKEASLYMLSMDKENEKLCHLKRSLKLMREIKSVKQVSNPRQLRQVIGTIKRNIRFFQLAGLEFEEVASCAQLYELSKQKKDLEGMLLAMANLLNHLHFIINDERTRNEFPGLRKLINGEGVDLLASHLKNLKEHKEHIQILIVFGFGNVIKLKADLGQLEKSYSYLCMLKEQIDQVEVKNDQEGSVNQLQFEFISFQLFLKYAPQSQVNPLMVVRKLFSGVRLLYKVSELYSLYLYDMLVELFCFSVPRYETKGLDIWITGVMKYFFGVGSVTRILDVLLIYTNWALCCENLEKCCPAMEYIAEILTRKSGDTKEDTGAVEVKLEGVELTAKVSAAIKGLEKSPSMPLEILGFKMNCLLARKCYIDKLYEQARKRYEDAWNGYEDLHKRINNYSLKMEFQQFYVNALFQLSNVYYKLNMPTKSFRFCEQTTVLISEILVNRLALTQEAYFQELAFKKDDSSRGSSVSPIQMEMAKLMNEKKSKTRKPSTGEEETPAKRTTSKRGKTPAKSAAVMKLDQLDSFAIPTLPIVVAVDDENSAVSLNNNAKNEDTQRKTSSRRIPVRSSNSTKTTATEKALAAKTPGSKRKTAAVVEQTPDPPSSSSVIGTRKTSRRLI